MTPRLRIFGKIWDREYFRYLESIVLDLGLETNVVFEVNQPGSELRSALASSDAFVTMSEHEGFMVPLLESFSAGCPVVGMKSTAITETCGPAGALLPTADINAVAGMAVALKRDRDSRMAVIRAQSQRAQAFAEGRTWNKWRMILEDFVPQLRNA
ncbi:glycosyltransferase involved in cell wall biosynthesis [Brevundimonas variabilis]|uniref:Glycosyltransferase involved in cell wall biosynthesis n=2 Tax=Brevundimonas variabilis TaxID=74312 RepID=A0A7W9FDE0_9CAUL|nr:glycosyltransferase involved in cell wall biosynthesis [Brevundimonas variabilis]